MYLRISFDFTNERDIKTIEVDVEHFSCWFGNEQVLDLYDYDLNMFSIPLKYIYTFLHVDNEDAGIDFPVFRNLFLAFENVGLREVNNELT